MTFQAIVVDQFTRLRDGDRFFYELLPQSMRILARHTKLSTVIVRNTDATINDLRHEVMRLAPAAEGALFGFESAGAWQVISGTASANSNYFTDGNSSLNLSGTNMVIRSASNFSASVFAGAEEILIDVFVPQDINENHWAGLVQAYLDCPAASVNSDFVGQSELTLLPRGQFNTASLTIPQLVQSRLGQNPGASCTIRIELNTNGSATPYALDRLRARCGGSTHPAGFGRGRVCAPFRGRGCSF
jgi:hypothetical protein